MERSAIYGKVEAVTDDERYRNILVHSYPPKSSYVKALKSKLDELEPSTVARIDRFISANNHRIKQTSDILLTRYIVRLDQHQWDEYLGDLEQHFAYVCDMSKETVKDASRELACILGLTLNRKQYPHQMKSTDEEKAYLKVITHIAISDESVWDNLLFRTNKHRDIQFQETKLIPFILNNPDVADDLIELIVIEKIERLIIIEERLNGMDKSPLNVGVL